MMSSAPFIHRTIAISLMSLLFIHSTSGFTTEKLWPTATSQQETTTSVGKTNTLPEMAAENDETTDHVLVEIMVPKDKEEIPPLVTYPETPSTLMISQHSDIEIIKCKAKGYPQPVFKWLRDGITLLSEDKYLQAYANGTLVLNYFSRNDNGYFQCRASNAHGTSVSEIIHIVAEQFSKGKEHDYKYTAKEGDPFELKCDATPVTVPPMEKRWYMNKNNELRLNARKGVNLEGTLLFSSTVAGEDNEIYTCGLVPESGTKNRILLYTMGELRVMPRNNEPFVSTKPKLMYSKDLVKAVIGRSVILECFFASKPPAIITWLNSSNHEVTKDNLRFQILDFGRKLRVVKVQQNDEGVFTCIGKNDLGSEEKTITVNVTSPPMVIPGQALHPQTVPDNRDITLNCKTRAAVGENLAYPVWYRNGVILTSRNLPDPSRYKFNSDFTKLTIQDLNKRFDTACFQCNTSNSEGYRFFDSYLRVINSIVIMKSPADVNTIEYGDVIDMTIHATGDNCCKINLLWYFNGSLIQPEKLLPFQRDSDRLLFNSSLVPVEDLPSYIGSFTCRVSNLYQSVDVIFDIIMKGRQPEPYQAKSSSFAIWWVALICGLGAIIIVVIIVIVVYKSNYPRSTYQLEAQEIKHHLNPEEDLLNQSFHEI